MRYYNKARQLKDQALCKMVAHLYHQKEVREVNCIYTDKGRNLLFKQPPNLTGDPLILYVIGHGLEGQAGITDRLEAKGKQLLRGAALSYKVNDLLRKFEVPLDYPIQIKLPFCYGGLKQPSLQAFVEHFQKKLMESNCELTVRYNHDHPEVTKVFGQGAMPVKAVQERLDAALKSDFFPEEERARTAIARMKWDTGEQEFKVWNRSLAEEIAVNLRGAFGQFSNVACGGFEHRMSYVTSKDLQNGSAPLPEKVTFPVTQRPTFPGMKPLKAGFDTARAKKVHFDGRGRRMLDAPRKPKGVQRYCYFPFHFETTSRGLLKLERLDPPEFDEAWESFY